jgi:hypothetical protein
MADQPFKDQLPEGVGHAPWDDPTKPDEERWAEYKKRYDLILLPPKYPDDPKEGEYERIPGSFEIPLASYPGWRMGFVPKGAIRFQHVIRCRSIDEAVVSRRRRRGA